MGEIIDGIPPITDTQDPVDPGDIPSADYPSNSYGDTILVNTCGEIYVPEAMKRLSVQYNHNIDVIRFQCPRYWCGSDLSNMTIYINYVRKDGATGKYTATNVDVNTTNTIYGPEEYLTFDWVISRNVTEVKGKLYFNVCAKKTDESGNELNHWNSELCKECYISEGLETDTVVEEEYPDVLTAILERLAEIDDLAPACDVNILNIGHENMDVEDVHNSNDVYSANTVNGMFIMYRYVIEDLQNQIDELKGRTVEES